MSASLMGQHPVAILLAIPLLLAAAYVASLAGRLLAAWLAIAEFRSGRWVGLVLGVCSVMPPVIFSVGVFKAMPLDLLDTRWARLGVLFGVEAVLVIPLAALVAYPGLVAAWATHGRALQSAGAGRWQAVRLLLRLGRPASELAWGIGYLRIALELGALLLLADRLDPAVRALPAALLGDGAAAAPDALPALGLSLLSVAIFMAVFLAFGRIPGFFTRRK